MTYMTCPKCGLTVQARAQYLVVDRCPRCLARRRQLVQMQATDAPSAARVAGAPAPGASRFARFRRDGGGRAGRDRTTAAP